jgi:hypothetical protein
MKRHTHLHAASIAAIGMMLFIFAAAAVADLAAPSGYDLSWYTIDGGGGTSSGATYDVNGTIGQPDAGLVMAGAGGYSVVGGFWPAAEPAANPCPADIAAPAGVVNAADLLAVINSWGACPGCHADINHDNVVNAADLLAVINSWGPCP